MATAPGMVMMIMMLVVVVVMVVVMVVVVLMVLGGGDDVGTIFFLFLRTDILCQMCPTNDVWSLDLDKIKVLFKK